MSFSDVVNEIQGDKEKGLMCIAMTNADSIIKSERAEALIKDVSLLKDSILSESGRIVNICKHLEITEVFRLKVEDSLLVINPHSGKVITYTIDSEIDFNEISVDD